MASIPTSDQVRSLAPDVSAARAGEGLANPRRWSAIGREDRAAWGQCQGSGASPYQVAIDFNGPAFKCSCPSRKFPCKHGLGLLFLLAADAAAFPAAEPPPWAVEWLTSRHERAEAAEARAQSREARAAAGEQADVVDTAARQRRIAARERKVQAGIVDLDRWLQDLVRRGLAAAKGEGYHFWDQAGARLVDAQAAALGREVRALGATFNSGAGWAEWALERVGRLHLIVEAYSRLERLPPDLRYDVRGLVGWTIKEDELPRDTRTDDRWLVVGRTVTSDERLTTVRTWLLGDATGRFALHLAFGGGGASPPAIGLPGASFRAALVFYPSATPLRVALSGDPHGAPSFDAFPATARLSIAQAAHAFTDLLARNPFLTSWPMILDEVVPVSRDGALFLRDANAATILVRPASIGARLMAAAGGRPVSAFGVWTGTGFRILSAIAESRITDLGTETAEATDDADQDAGLGAPRSIDGSAWGQLVSTALLGTERTELPDPSDLPLGHAIDPAAFTRRGPESRLLAMVGVAAASRMSGHVPAADDGPLLQPAPADPRPVVSPQLGWILSRTIEDRLSLLIEWLDLCAARGRRPPDDELPRLLGIASSNAHVREALDPLLGPRARWLVEQMPGLAEGMAPQAVEASAEAWANAWSTNDRVATLSAIRTTDPGLARELLDTAWPDLATHDRARCLEVFSAGLADEDRPLLERALADPRVEPRAVATDLLLGLPGSELAGLAEAIARPALAAAGRVRPSLEVQLPVWTDDLGRIGVPRKAPQGVGERSWWLRHVIGRVAPAHWQEWLNADPAALIERARRSEEAAAVLLGWIDAARRFEDKAWALALLRDEDVAGGRALTPSGASKTAPGGPMPVIAGWQTAVTPTAQIAPGDDPLALLDILDGADRKAAAARLLGNLEPERAVAAAERVARPWSQEMDDAALHFLGREGQIISKAFVDLCRMACERMSPSRSADFEFLVIGQTNRLMTYPGLDQFLQIMTFRAQMTAAFAANDA